MTFILFPTPISVPSAGDAIETMGVARTLGLPHSYHPHGGWRRDNTYVEITHTVYVLGTDTEIQKLKKELEKNK